MVRLEHCVRNRWPTNAANDQPTVLLCSSDALVLSMPRSVIIPAGSWPRRMRAELAAGYCGESTVEAFLKRVGSEYPQPRITEGRRRLWLRDDLDQAILPTDLNRVRDVAEDL